MIKSTDIGGFTSPNGKPVVFHFQEAVHATVVVEDRAGTQMALLRTITGEFADIDVSTSNSVHIVINKKGGPKFLSAEDFATFQAGEWPEIKIFSGPTEARAEELLGNPIVEMINFVDEDCAVCVVSGHLCPMREKDFDEEALKLALANFQP